jgi:predicted 3-demethylubiquinone-9 3-methyltransferase (glyoxalase superfamily)
VATEITTFLMFEGRAEEAMTLYASLFDGAEIASIERYGAGEDGAEGTVKKATLRLPGQALIFFDSPVEHAFGFTPAISLFVDCGSEREVDELFAGLAEGGAVLMGLDAYPFSKRFGWVNDRFGVSWQLNLADD